MGGLPRTGPQLQKIRWAAPTGNGLGELVFRTSAELRQRDRTAGEESRDHGFEHPRSESVYSAKVRVGKIIDRPPITLIDETV
jgi:hypothetical protein